MKRATNYLRVLWVALSILFISCESEGLYVKESTGKKSSIKIRHLKNNEAKKAAGLLKRIPNLNFGDNTMKADMPLAIDYNDILEVVDSSGIKNYSYKIINHPEDNFKTFHNLVLRDEENQLKVSVMKYEMTDLFAEEYYAKVKAFQQFEGYVSTESLATASDPCEEISIGHPASGGGSGGSGNSGNNPGSPGYSGGVGGGCMTLSFECSCGRSYHSWDDYAGSICGNGSNPGYSLTIVINTSAFCRGASNPCGPKGSIGVVPPDIDCKTSKEDLKLVFPNTPDDILEEIANNINEYGKDFGIDTKEKLQHFLSQAGHESTSPVTGIEFGSFTENLNYRVSKLGTPNYWEKYFNPIDDPTADPLKANPNDYISSTSTIFVNHELFANYVYDDAYREEKYKLGNVYPGDGYKFRGRGIFQLTGRKNYTDFNTFYNENYDASTDLLESPDLIASDMKIAVISALWYFKNKVLDEMETLDANTKCSSVTLLVNGGTRGLVHRNSLFSASKDHINCL